MSKSWGIGIPGLLVIPGGHRNYAAQIEGVLRVERGSRLCELHNIPPAAAHMCPSYAGSDPNDPGPLTPATDVAPHRRWLPKFAQAGRRRKMPPEPNARAAPYS